MAFLEMWIRTLRLIKTSKQELGSAHDIYRILDVHSFTQLPRLRQTPTVQGSLI